MTATNLVFVYGTLRKGGSNHRLLENSRFVTDATIRGRIHDCWGFPGLIRIDETQDSSVVGECYYVTNEVLADLDWLEGHPNFFQRLLVDVYPGVTQDIGPAWAYFYKDIETLEEDCPVILSGDWIRHVNRKHETIKEAGNARNG